MTNILIVTNFDENIRFQHVITKINEVKKLFFHLIQ